MKWRGATRAESDEQLSLIGALLCDRIHKTWPEDGAMLHSLNSCDLEGRQGRQRCVSVTFNRGAEPNTAKT